MKGLEIPALIFSFPNAMSTAIQAGERLIGKENRAMIRTAKIDQIRIDGQCGFGDLIRVLNPSAVDKLANPLMPEFSGITPVCFGAASCHDFQKNALSSGGGIVESEFNRRAFLWFFPRRFGK